MALDHQVLFEIWGTSSRCTARGFFNNQNDIAKTFAANEGFINAVLKHCSPVVQIR